MCIDKKYILNVWKRGKTRVIGVKGHAVRPQSSKALKYLYNIKSGKVLLTTVEKYLCC